MGLGIFRLQPDRFVEILKRLVVASLLAVDDAAADIGRGIRRVDRQRLVLIGQRLIELVDPAVYKRAIGIGLRVIGVEADRLVEVGQRLLGPTGFAIDRTPHVVSLRIVRMRGDDLAERSDIGLRAGIERLILVGGARTARSGTAGEGDEHRGQHDELRRHVRSRLGRSAAHCGARITARGLAGTWRADLNREDLAREDLVREDLAREYLVRADLAREYLPSENWRDRHAKKARALSILRQIRIDKALPQGKS